MKDFPEYQPPISPSLLRTANNVACLLCFVVIYGVVIEKERREVFVTFQSHFGPSHLTTFASATYATAISFRT
jgi:hypothetical protein